MISAKFKRTKFIDPEKLLEMTVREFLPSAGVFVTGEAKLRSPVDKGQLRASINHRVETDLVRIGTNVHYAPHVEYGTYKMSAQPYLRPAVDENRKKLVSMFRQIMARFKKGMTRGR